MKFDQIVSLAESGASEQSYVDGEASSGFKIGQDVVVARKAKDYERGWGNNWCADMNDAVGKTYRILRMMSDEESSAGVELMLKLSNGIHELFFFPYFVLIPTKEYLRSLKTSNKLNIDV